MSVSITSEDAFASNEVPMGALEAITAYAEQAGRNWDLHVAGLIYITFVTLFGFPTYAPISYNMPILSVSVIDGGGRIADR